MGDIQEVIKIVAVISLKKLRNMLAVLRGLSACQVVCEIMISPRAQLGIPLMLTALDLVKLIASARERKPRRIFIHENIVHRHTPSGSLSSSKIKIYLTMLFILCSTLPPASALSALARLCPAPARAPVLQLCAGLLAYILLDHV